MITMDKLDEIFEGQRILDERIAEKFGLIYPENLDPDVFPDEYEGILKDWLHALCIAMQVEIAEILEASQYKWWKEYPEPVDIEHVKEEATDVFHFLLSLMNKLGMTPDEIYAKYQEKNKVNHKRQDDNYGR